MANSFLKPTRIAAAALGLLEREIILPGLVWRDAGGDFAGAGGDTISIRVPARTQAKSRQLRGSRSAAVIQHSELTETKVDVTLDEDIYNSVPTTDEELSLDIVSFGEQVLRPQVRAVAEGLENKLANEMLAATYANTITLDTVDPYNSLVDARVAMNKANVPMSERFCVVGADMEGVFLKSKHISEVDKSGSDSALRDAIIGRVAGFGNVYVSNALPADVGFAFHKTAYVLSLKAPRVPSGASAGSSQSFQGLALRWLQDYDYDYAQDRSLVDVFAGTNIVADGSSNETQTATITGGPTGGSFTLTYAGQTTGAIAYNASAATVKAALIALSNIEPQDVTVSLSGAVYTINFGGQFAGTNVAALTATPSLTGGSSPSVAIATPTGGGAPTFVRAVKFTF